MTSWVALQLIGKPSYSQNNASLLGVVLNKVNPREHSIISQQVKSKVQSHGFAFAGALPFNPLLQTVRLVVLACASQVPSSSLIPKPLLCLFLLPLPRAPVPPASLLEALKAMEVIISWWPHGTKCALSFQALYRA